MSEPVVLNAELISEVLELISSDDWRSFKDSVEEKSENWNTGETLFPTMAIDIIIDRETFSDEHLRRFLTLIGEADPAFHTKDLILLYQNEADILLYLKRLENVTRSHSDKEMKELLLFISQTEGLSDTIGAREVRSLFQKRLAFKTVAPTPSHIIHNELSSIPEKLPSLQPGDIKPIGKADLLSVLEKEKAKYSDFDIEIKDMEEAGVQGPIIQESGEERKKLEKDIKIDSKISQQKRREAFAFISIDEKAIRTLIQSEILHRMFGPPNPYSDMDLLEITDDNRYGGARMLLDNSFDMDGDIDEDWYTGICAFCQRSMYSRRYACRIPVVGGGWRGCYCSWEHVKEEILTPKDDEDEISEEDEIKREIQLVLVNRFVEEINKIGVFARISASDPDEKAERERRQKEQQRRREREKERKEEEEKEERKKELPKKEERKEELPEKEELPKKEISRKRIEEEEPEPALEEEEVEEQPSLGKTFARFIPSER